MGEEFNPIGILQDQVNQRIMDIQNNNESRVGMCALCGSVVMGYNLPLSFFLWLFYYEVNIQDLKLNASDQHSKQMSLWRQYRKCEKKYEISLMATTWLLNPNV